MIKTIHDIPEHVFKTSYQNATIGHVLTPPKLALEMIETLPSELTKSGIKLLDPACKNGSFLFQWTIKLLDKDLTIKEIENCLYTCDSLSASLRIAESGIKHIFRFPYQNSLVKINQIFYKYPEVEREYDKTIKTISKNKYISIRSFINDLLLNKKDHWLIMTFEENLIEFIKRYDGLSKSESKIFGEVFTPQALIEEMLDTLPKEVWTNKDLRWLDSCVGIGNFPAAILQRLTEGLEKEIPNEEERRKHILEEMLFMGDISTKNLFLLYQLFDANNEFKLNVFRGDFLSDKFDNHMKNVWGLDGFDLVVGNPPYNWSDGENQRRNNRENLWTRFVFKSMEILKENGFLCLVTPKAWMSPSADFGKKSIIKDIMIPYNPIYINIDDCSKYFNVGSTFSFFTIIKNKNEGKTNIKTLNDEFEFSFTENKNRFEFDDGKFTLSIPVIFNSKTISISNKFFSKDNEKFNFKQRGVATRDEKFFDVITNEYKYINFHTNSKNEIYSRFESDDKNLDKIIICLSGEYKANVDVNKISHTNMSCVDVIDGENPVNLDITLNSKLYNFIMNKLYKYNGWVNMKCVQNLPKPSLVYKKDKIDESDVYKYFNLTEEEIKLIEDTIGETTNKKRTKKSK